MTELEEYYNKFNEEKRLNSRHGQVEFRTSMKYIHEAINIITQCSDAPKSSPENSDGPIAPALSPQDIKILDISEVSVIADYFVIANGTNSSQVEAMVDEVTDALAKQKIHAERIEGIRSSGWILMDYGDVIVHIFSPYKRIDQSS